MKTITTTFKFPIIKPIQTDWKTFADISGDLSYHLIKVMNDAMTMNYIHIQEKFKYEKENGIKYDVQKYHGVKTYSTVISRELKDKYMGLGIPGDLLDQSVRQSLNVFRTNSLDVLKGNSSLMTFRRDQPIPVRARSLKLTDKYTVNLPFMTKDIAEDNGFTGKRKQSFEVQLGVKGNGKVILDRILNGEYKACDSAVQKTLDGKWFLLLSYKQPVKENKINPDIIVGIDLGITKAAYLAVNNSKQNYFIDGGEVSSFRRKMKSRRKSFQNQLRVCSDNRRGHGRKTLLKPLEDLKSKERNFRNTVNHRYSKKIIEWTIKQGAGTIQMEDLSGINKMNSFLKNWDYYDLQQKIKYKAQLEGINFVLINPEYTSQRCNKCGNIDKNSRNYGDQSKFICTSCDNKTNADLNAARNISIKNISEIIKKELK